MKQNNRVKVSQGALFNGVIKKPPKTLRDEGTEARTWKVRRSQPRGNRCRGPEAGRNFKCLRNSKRPLLHGENEMNREQETLEPDTQAGTWL